GRGGGRGPELHVETPRGLVLGVGLQSLRVALARGFLVAVRKRERRVGRLPIRRDDRGGCQRLDVREARRRARRAQGQRQALGLLGQPLPDQRQRRLAAGGTRIRACRRRNRRRQGEQGRQDDEHARQTQASTRRALRPVTSGPR